MGARGKGKTFLHVKKSFSFPRITDLYREQREKKGLQPTVTVFRSPGSFTESLALEVGFEINSLVETVECGNRRGNFDRRRDLVIGHPRLKRR